MMKVSAVDYIAATTVICTDKTGTLTEGKMTASMLTGVLGVVFWLGGFGGLWGGSRFDLVVWFRMVW